MTNGDATMKLPLRHDTPSNVPTVPAADSPAEVAFHEEMLRTYRDRCGRPKLPKGVK